MITVISIVPANPHSLDGAKLNLMAVGDLAHTIAGSSNQSIVGETFQKLWQSKHNRFSHEYAFEAKMGDKTLGMITCLPISVLEQLISSTAKQLFSYRKLGLIAYNLQHLRAFFSTISLKEGFEGEYHIATLAAIPESRGMGIGSQLIEHAEKQAIKKGYSVISLTVKKENHLAAKLYSRLGYEITSEVNKPSVSLYRMVKKLTI